MSDDIPGDERLPRRSVPWPLLLALVALVIEAAALISAGGVLLWGGLSNGGLVDMMALGGFFLVLGLFVGACVLALVRRRGFVRGAVVTVQVLLAAGVLSTSGTFDAWFVALTCVVAIVATLGLLVPATREYLSRERGGR